MKIGLDIGSTTLKAVVISGDKIIYKNYKRHFSKIAQSAGEMLGEIAEKIGNARASICISGSAGIGIADQMGIPFVQEVYATRIAADKLAPNTDVVIELGGEDAKILFLTDEKHQNKDLEVRMNGSCAGGTGAFIDQMATLLAISPDEMNNIAQKSEKTYTVASRCGVFAKSDIQPLINQGARKADIAASIFQAVVNQTIAGLAQGRPIDGNILYLGGPLTFLPALRKSFDSTLNLVGNCPENSLFYVAIGAAMKENNQLFDIEKCAAEMNNYTSNDTYMSMPPLFENRQEYDDFKRRHEAACVLELDNPAYSGSVFIGIDAGSTTFKAVVIDEDENILKSHYQTNDGDPVALAKGFLEDFYASHPAARVKGSAVTGYGEDIIKNAFSVDSGLVETMAHFTAARKFRPDVDFIIDIGGQDIKCFKIRNGAIDNIFLNEACSSGCGSFLQTFAGAWGMDPSEFAQKGLFAQKPVDLGSRCTVFMNSSVKQAQKDGALIEDISAGLSVSVVKNAIYKVIRASSADQLGQHIVVQGGTFISDLVLRAFEKEIGRQVIRPNIAGLMGAYGAALYAKRYGKGVSTLADSRALAAFSHKITMTNCTGCSNNCRLTVNTFDGGRRFIGGNRCERMTSKSNQSEQFNIYEYKMSILQEPLTEWSTPSKGTIGLAMGLNMYELLPFWHKVFTHLGFNVKTSPKSSRDLYLLGQKTIPSDTVCYPAKLIHGHVEALIDDTEVDAVFYPCLTYNIDEGRGDNHYNCPVVAYYPEVIQANTHKIGQKPFIYDYMTLTNEKMFASQLQKALEPHFGKISKSQIRTAFKLGHNEYVNYLNKVRNKSEEYLKTARVRGLPVIILAGRPYHLDGEVNHGIDGLARDLGAVVLSEDGVSHFSGVVPTNVLDQWTYHSRLYAAADYVSSQDDSISFVQLVSFGCGLDAVTTDECRRIIEEKGGIYTQIKIDEITNLGAVKIRLRSLFAALDMKKSH